MRRRLAIPLALLALSLAPARTSSAQQTGPLSLDVGLASSTRLFAGVSNDQPFAIQIQSLDLVTTDSQGQLVCQLQRRLHHPKNLRPGASKLVYIPVPAGCDSSRMFNFSGALFDGGGVFAGAASSGSTGSVIVDDKNPYDASEEMVYFTLKNKGTEPIHISRIEAVDYQAGQSVKSKRDVSYDLEPGQVTARICMGSNLQIGERVVIKAFDSDGNEIGIGVYQRDP